MQPRKVKEAAVDCGGLQVKSLNSRVVAFLQQGAINAQLLDYLTVLPDEGTLCLLG